MIRFHNQNQSLQFGTFVFGPIVMRLLHHLSKPELALKLFKDPVVFESLNSNIESILYSGVEGFLRSNEEYSNTNESAVH